MTKVSNLQLAGSSHSGKVDWGNVPAWVGAILSGLSVLLALSIIVRDRRKAARDQAARVSVWTELDRSVPTENGADAINQNPMLVQIFNGSDAAIAPVFVFVHFIDADMAAGRLRRLAKFKGEPLIRRSHQTLHFALFKKFDVNGDPSDVIPAGVRASFLLDLDYPYELVDISVIFHDMGGVRWQRDARTRRLSKVRLDTHFWTRYAREWHNRRKRRRIAAAWKQVG